MNNDARTALAQLIKKYGQGLCDDARRTEALLRDTCPEHRKEVSVLLGALRERVPTELLGAHAGTPMPMVIGRLATRLEDQLGLALDSARWAVESWAVALGVASPSDIARPPVTASIETSAVSRPVGSATTRPHTASGASTRGHLTFLMPIQDIFSIPGRGIVVTGVVQEGAIKVGTRIAISGGSRPLSATVKGIEMFRKLLTEAHAGDNVGLLLEGVTREELAPGHIMSAPATAG